MTLVCTYLDVEKGLRYPILSAERGSRECQALVLRWHAPETGCGLDIGARSVRSLPDSEIERARGGEGSA
jgi:hypothetical protein